ncbi:translation initiation factor IF-2 [Candidatus Gromoviella agglomerans]|uniref:translation initiation factor IF-2 n=1 Tax=Candidatus Gromoviella agglomerans TaxID=2806609 RepID=UPI001E45672C|nr:translation initiation factor IF-2 [Candidatus Gromoviella agglomerans]UFX98163.1 Translation initiation factor IF-2 [Candidatus Gromoviella agglomerans]
MCARDLDGSMSSDDKDRKILSLKITPSSGKSLPPQKVKQSFSYGRSKNVEVEIVSPRNKSLPKNDSEKEEGVASFGNLTKDEIKARLDALKNMKVNQKEHSDIVNLNEEDVVESSVQNSTLIFDSNIPDIVEKHVITHKSKIQIKEYEHKPTAKDTDIDSERNYKKKKKEKLFAKEDVYIPDVDDDIEEGVSIIDELYEEDIQKEDVHSSVRHKTKIKKTNKNNEILVSSGGIVIADLAHRLSVSVGEIERIIQSLGGNINDKKIPREMADIIIEEFGKISISSDPAQRLIENAEKSFRRPPIVVVMGHVDHGKTSLLDKMRNASIASQEKGGITQHIGAYTVKTDKGNITFIDTPGHAMFRDMRARGAQFTDIIVLVVAADDGVKAQTLEAIQHAQSAKVPIIVAINKIDKDDINTERVRQELAEHNVIVEKYGGDVMEVQISAKTGQGIKELQEAILLQMEMIDAKTYEKGRAVGVILESKTDKGNGHIATVIILNGTLNNKDVFVCGNDVGRVRFMISENGQKIKSAGPSCPVVVAGFESIPQVGEKILVSRNEKEAKAVAKQRKENELSKIKEKDLLYEVRDRVKKGKELNFIVKADTAGSMNAIVYAIESMSEDNVKISVMHSDVGDISENDISIAYLGDATIIAFNVKSLVGKPKPQYANVKIQHYGVVYSIIDDIQSLIADNTEQKFNEIFLGSAEVIQIFDMKNDNNDKYRVAGCVVRKGSVCKSQKFRIIRNGNVIASHVDVISLQVRRIDEDEVSAKEECGIVFKKYNNVQIRDVVECFKLEKI